MAIAVDANSGLDGGTGTTFTWNHTCTGSNLILWAGVLIEDATITATATYNGVAMNATSNSPQVVNVTQRVYLFFLLNPSTGSNNIVVTTSSSIGGIRARSTSYTGVKQSGQPDALGQNSGVLVTSLATTVTSIADNCWVMGIIRDDTAATTAGASTTLRNDNGNAVFAIYDTNAAVTPAGLTTLNVNCGTPGGMVMVAASFSPFGAVVSVPFLPLLGVG